MLQLQFFGRLLQVDLVLLLHSQRCVGIASFQSAILTAVVSVIPASPTPAAHLEFGSQHGLGLVALRHDDEIGRHVMRRDIAQEELMRHHLSSSVEIRGDPRNRRMSRPSGMELGYLTGRGL